MTVNGLICFLVIWAKVQWTYGIILRALLYMEGVISRSTHHLYAFSK